MARHILLVEDNRDIRSAFRKLLAFDGYTVTTARDGRAGLERLEECDHLDLILLDLMMPNMSGWAFRERQSDLDLFTEVPLIVITAVEYNVNENMDELGADALLRKPVGPEALLDTVSRTISDES